MIVSKEGDTNRWTAKESTKRESSTTATTLRLPTLPPLIKELLLLLRLLLSILNRDILPMVRSQNRTNILWFVNPNRCSKRKSKKEKLCIQYLNARSAKKKIQLLKQNLIASTRPPHIIALTETWFDESVPDFDIPGYDVYKKNRTPDTSKKKEGGGLINCNWRGLLSNNILLFFRKQ